MVYLELAFLLCTFATGYTYKISLTSNAPVVVGATVSFKASVTDDYGKTPGGSYEFRWKDNAIPGHSHTFDGEYTTSTWNVPYPKDQYSSGTYEVQVEVLRWTIFYWSIGSRRLYFDLTPLLNGGMNMTQNNQTVEENYVSSASEVTHYIHFTDPDETFLKKKATSVIAYWFVDCIYYGATSDLTFKYNYSSSPSTSKKAHVETLVVASFEPIPPPTTTTTTTTTVAPTTTKPSTTTPSTTTIPTTTPKPSNNITAIVQPNLKLGSNVSEIPILPYVCLNTSIVSPDPKKTYGYFSQKIEVKAPVTNVVVSGNNWLQHGDILNLSVSCNGSSPFRYCFQIHPGGYNITGNESCINELYIEDCQLTVPRYFQSSGSYTVVIIIGNLVSKKVTPVGVNIYEVKKHPQLSVIVVPVAFVAIAVTMIVFGAAYYQQSRHRYTIEVADFDFAQASDMEYMTFGQRLRVALNNAFIRTHEVDPKLPIDKKCEDGKSVNSTCSAATTTTEVSEPAKSAVPNV